MRLSVVIPAHNAAPYLAAAIDSVLAELPADSEVIAVDDGSTDGTARVLEAYRDRITIISRPLPSNPGVARNTGAAAARGDVLAFHDADDLVLPGRFRDLLAVLDADPSVDLVFGNGIKITADGRPLGPVIPVRYTRRLKRGVDVARLLEGSFIYPQGMCVRRAAFERLGGFTVEKAEDWEFALRATLVLGVRFVDKAVFAYRQYEGSVTSRQHEFAHQMLDMLETFLAQHPQAIEVAGKRLVDRALAKRIARCARHRLKAGDVAGAAEALERAIALHPTSLRYRWRLLTLPRAGQRPARIS
ncbi:MAG TPA: glycosyltransferase family 2 protein [Candidatus Binatia bacterium]